MHPLRALAFAEQVTHRVWVRNGEEIRRAAGVYASRYAAGVGRDADFGFAQMALVAFVEEDEQRRTLLLHETQSLDVVRFVLAVGSAGAARARARKRRGVSVSARGTIAFVKPSRRRRFRPRQTISSFVKRQTTTLLIAQ